MTRKTTPVMIFGWNHIVIIKEGLNIVMIFVKTGYHSSSGSTVFVWRTKFQQSKVKKQNATKLVTQSLWYWWLRLACTLNPCASSPDIWLNGHEDEQLSLSFCHHSLQCPTCYLIIWHVQLCSPGKHLKAWHKAQGYIFTIPTKRSNAERSFDHLKTVKYFYSPGVCIPNKCKQNNSNNSFILQSAPWWW